MATIYEDQQGRAYQSLHTTSGEIYTFFYAKSPQDRMAQFTLHVAGLEPELLGSAVPLFPIQLGQRALLGIDRTNKDFHLLETAVVTHLGQVVV